MKVLEGKNIKTMHDSVMSLSEMWIWIFMANVKE